MASNTNPSVLIVGAGPTGLILGTELCRRDIHVRLIDQRSHPATSSRAFTVHSRTLEAFESIGICSYALTRGLRATEMKYHFVEEGKSVSSCINLRFSSDVVSGRFPFICTMPQTVTEELCRQAFEASGGVIEWGVSLDSFEELDGVVRTVLATEGRGTERAEFPFLVGCDGAKSSVRKGLDLDFSGTAYTGMTMKMMDVSLNNSLPKEYGPEGYHYFIKQGSMLLLAKMGDAQEYGEEKDIWRVLISTKEEEPDISVAAFQAAVDRVLDGVTVGEPVWTTAYRIHKRMASSYASKGHRILLAGDSAHINSPAGGMGMNCAIQDGFNLGWRLAMVVDGTLRKDALADYEKERRPIAQKVLKGTDLLHSIIMAHGKGLSDRISLASSEKWAESVVKIISGNGFSYAAPVSENEHLAAPFGNATLRVRAGDHAPDVFVRPLLSAEGPCLLSRVPGLGFVVVAFCKFPLETGQLLEDLFGGGIVTVAFAAEVNSIRTAGPLNSLLCDQYGDASFALVRPDKYIASLFRGDVDIVGAVREALLAIGVGATSM